MQRITDPVIDNAIGALPPEYASSSRGIAATLKARRNGLRDAADRYYHELWRVADIHGTDADDEATVVRSGEGSWMFASDPETALPTSRGGST